MAAAASNLKHAAGHGDEVQKMIAAIRALAESDDEKETLTYRTTRGEGPGNEDTFAVFEEYILPDGIAAHVRHDLPLLSFSTIVS